ncbi:MAG TPA: NUDIX domain-containing protein [Gaiellaceae bacterium]|nr:NUDIX domain-containing protein [Gaiellaceae bacterium]
MGVLDGWRVCPRCGAELELGPGRAHCPACRSTYYAGSAPAVEGLVAREGKVLLVRRGIEPRRGHWDLPGGFLEEGEEPLAGLRRELREETGLEAEPVELLGTHVEPYDDHFVLGLTWRVEAAGEPEPADDVAELAWFGPEELPAEMAFAHQRGLLAAWAARERRAPGARSA